MKRIVKTRDKYSERLTHRELDDLMGVNRPTFARKKGGAYRQRKEGFEC